MGKKTLVMKLAKNLRMRIKMILLISFLSIALVWSLTSFLMVPDYQATTQLIIEQPSPAAGMAAVPAMDAGPSVADTFSAIIRSPEMLGKVIIEMGLKTEVSELHEQITVVKPDDSQVLNITVAGSDQTEAAAIANLLAVIFIEEIPNLTQGTSATIISEASAETESTFFEENRIFSLGVAGAFGLIVGVLLAFILELLNTLFITGKKENQAAANRMQTVFK